MDKVRLGIIGLGAMGCQYAEMIAHGQVPGMELAQRCKGRPVIAGR